MKDILQHITNDWTLFLDRDGVLNHQKEGSYIFNREEFVFYDGVLQAMHFFATRFKYIIIVTNQRGVGKGLMTEQDLHHIHQHMQQAIELAGGRVDAIYYAAELESTLRKPNAGMAIQAKNDFPAIDFNRSVMVGNSMSDMEFGRNIGACNVFVTTTNKAIHPGDERIDVVCESLPGFAAALQSLR